jgi:hypothetical protein
MNVLQTRIHISKSRKARCIETATQFFQSMEKLKDRGAT